MAATKVKKKAANTPVGKKTANPQLVENPLSDAALQTLQAAYKVDEMKQLLETFLPKLYLPSKNYSDAINARFYGNLQDDSVPTKYRDALSVQDVERCVIALLASRGEQPLLAVHIYIALMEGITPAEIGNIILLAGIYSGVGNFTQGILTEIKTLELLNQLATKTPPKKLVLPPPGLGANAVVHNLMSGFGLT